VANFFLYLVERDDTQPLLGYVLLTKFSFRILFLHFSIMFALVTGGLWWIEDSCSGALFPVLPINAKRAGRRKYFRGFGKLCSMRLTSTAANNLDVESTSYTSRMPIFSHLLRYFSVSTPLVMMAIIFYFGTDMSATRHRLYCRSGVSKISYDKKADQNQKIHWNFNLR